MSAAATVQEDRRVIRTETALGKVLLVEHGTEGDGCFGHHRVELPETREVLHCGTVARVYEEVVVGVVRTGRDQVVSAVLRREQAEIGVAPASRTARR